VIPGDCLPPKPPARPAAEGVVARGLPTARDPLAAGDPPTAGDPLAARGRLAV
jgi:hypothetical protein